MHIAYYTRDRVTRQLVVAGMVLMAFVSMECAGDASRQSVSFPTSDGGVVYANEYGSGEHAVVLAHGGRFNKESWDVQAPVIAKAGFRVLAIDFRGRGKSHGGPEPNASEDLDLDVLAAVRYLRGSGAQTVSVVGASLGGWATAMAAVAKPGQIDRMILLAPPPIHEPEKLSGRKLWITSRGDVGGGGVLRLGVIQQQYERAPDPKALVVLDGSAHAQFIFETDQGERLMQEILRFLSAP